MKCNVGKTERVVRISAGALIVLALLMVRFMEALGELSGICQFYFYLCPSFDGNDLLPLPLYR
ncbi:MAG: hypothetical protein K0R75_1901 [Paenibacillaceae bacterium]|nr:hypothetical protein [Paenibacillaceae bacterium]